MPQFIDFIANHVRVGMLMTKNLGRVAKTTSYKVSWCDNSGWHEVGDFDTGIECVPCKECQPEDFMADMRCDYTHVRRAIAAMADAADDICKIIQDEIISFSRIDLHFRTNGYYRGVLISIETFDNGMLTLAMKIGEVIGRVPDASMLKELEVSKQILKSSSCLQKSALQAIKSEREWLLDTLLAQARQ